MVLISFIVFSLILSFRLYDLQIIKGLAFREEANKQIISIPKDFFDRGSIFFTTRNGQTEILAGIRQGGEISIVPKNIKNPENLYNSLVRFIPIEHDDFIAKASKKNDPYEEIEKRVSKDISDSINKAKLEGVNVRRDSWRIYPADKIASHVIGFVGYKGDELAGRYGLESFYEDVLSRESGTLNTNFFAELVSGLRENILNKNKKVEGNIITSLEPRVQSALEKVLDDISQNWQPERSGIIIMDPKTGEIIAMGSRPNFNPNNFSEIKNVETFSNPLIEYVYEMGSIFKPLTIAMGIDTGSINSRSSYNDQGFLTIGDKTIYNFDRKGHGLVNMQDVLNKSLNTGVVFVVNKTGKDKFNEYIKKLVGSHTGIDLPNEAKSLISNLNTGRDIEFATASYGQGIALSPIATLRALATLANDGKLVNPHIVRKIEYSTGGFKDISNSQNIQVFRKETAEEVTRMLVNVVDTALKNGSIKRNNYSVAAKTGTAQIANKEEGGYYKDRYLHSFFGYFPAYNPRFIIFMYQTYPKGASYASETLVSPFNELVSFLINYYEIPPDR